MSPWFVSMWIVYFFYGPGIEQRNGTNVMRMDVGEHLKSLFNDICLKEILHYAKRSYSLVYRMTSIAEGISVYMGMNILNDKIIVS